MLKVNMIFISLTKYLFPLQTNRHLWYKLILWTAEISWQVGYDLLNDKIQHAGRRILFQPKAVMKTWLGWLGRSAYS